jgi:hypothetical protein
VKAIWVVQISTKMLKFCTFEKHSLAAPQFHSLHQQLPIVCSPNEKNGPWFDAFVVHHNVKR